MDLNYLLRHWRLVTSEGHLYNNNNRYFPDRNYRDYTIGTGIVVKIFDFKRLKFICSYHYSERFCFDRSQDRYHKNMRCMIGIVQIDKPLFFRGQKIDLWIAPAFVYDEIIQYPYGYHQGCADKSYNNFGFATGCELILLKHCKTFFYVVYADYWQPGYGVAYRF